MFIAQLCTEEYTHIRALNKIQMNNRMNTSHNADNRKMAKNQGLTASLDACQQNLSRAIFQQVTGKMYLQHEFTKNIIVFFLILVKLTVSCVTMIQGNLT